MKQPIKNFITCIKFWLREYPKILGLRDKMIGIRQEEYKEKALGDKK